MFALTRPLILASNSPRRKQLLSQAAFAFSVEVIPTDECYPETLDHLEVAAFISRGKADMFKGLRPGSIVLTADTVVIVDGRILGKPENHAEAVSMLKQLSGRHHEVVTAVTLLTDETTTTQSDTARVFFKPLTDSEINYYIENFEPFDKAGGYGIQEWISLIGIDRIEGSFYTIMGLPVHLVYELLKPYIAETSQ
jgi:septum formation protein